MRMASIITAAVLTVAAAGSASALPQTAKPDGATSLVQQTASWRYHRGCSWRDGRWVVDIGAGKIVVCRPNRPSGKYWEWHREGGREGWWDRRHKRWHHHF